MNSKNKQKSQKQKRARRVRKIIRGTTAMPRLSVYRSSRYIYAQIIDDEKKKTVLGVSEKNLTLGDTKTPKSDRAKQLGMLLAKMAGEKKIKKVVFDRGSYTYHGRVKAVAQGAREGGLQF